MNVNIDPNPKRSLTQRQSVLRYMMNGGSLTPRKAWLLFGTSKLATRISELRLKDGISVIEQSYIKVRTHGGGRTHVMRYWIRKENRVAV